jgi:hypothetical protein
MPMAKAGLQPLLLSLLLSVTLAPVAWADTTNAQDQAARLVAADKLPNSSTACLATKAKLDEIYGVNDKSSKSIYNEAIKTDACETVSKYNIDNQCSDGERVRGASCCWAIHQSVWKFIEGQRVMISSICADITAGEAKAKACGDAQCMQKTLAAVNASAAKKWGDLLGQRR